MLSARSRRFVPPLVLVFFAPACATSNVPPHSTPAFDPAIAVEPIESSHAAYYDAIKKAAIEAWNPSPALRARARSGDRLSEKWTTVVSVTLDDRGEIRELRVTKSSGVESLDRAAVEAFRKAAPFSNPPDGIADSNGEIHFSFAFGLETSR